MLILTQSEYDMLQRLLRVNNYSYDQFTRLEMETLRSLADRNLISFEDNQQDVLCVRELDSLSYEIVG